MDFDSHPTVRRAREQGTSAAGPAVLEAAKLRELCLEYGADDVGFVEVDRPEIADQLDDIRRLLPGAKSLISFVCRMGRAPIRSPARSVSNLEFHHTGDKVDEVARHIVAELERQGVAAASPAMGFPMETDHFPGKIWIVAHKPVAVAAGLGRTGIHRNVIHPKFGSFILLGTVAVAAEIDQYDAPIAYNPCLECKLCAAACPVGAVSPSGRFDFSACYTHNYREFLGGFTDWAESVVESRSAADYRRRVTDSESSSVWQSLSFGANYKAAFCVSVCPAGEDVIGPFLEDRTAFKSDVMRPLTEKHEPVYVVPSSDAEAHVRKRFPHKQVRHVGNSLRPSTIASFLDGLPLLFQPGQAKELDAVYHFVFTGEERAEATVIIRGGEIEVRRELDGKPDLRVTADSRTWIRFVRGEVSVLRALLTLRVRLRGSPRLLAAFGRCFPS